MRPYKGIEELIAAFRQRQDDSLLLIAGHVGVPAYGQQIAALAAGDPRIQFYPTYVADETCNTFSTPPMPASFPTAAPRLRARPCWPFPLPNRFWPPAIGPFPDLAGGWARRALWRGHGRPGRGPAPDAPSRSRRRLAAIRGFLVDRDWPTLGRQHLAMYRRALLARSTAAAAAMVN